jgi:hypothetical protein
MSEQVFSYGSKAKTILAEGYSTRKQLPIGYYHDNGMQRFRYAFLRNSPRAAMLMATAKVAGSYFALTSAYFRSATATFGGQAGDNCIKLYSAKFLGSANAPATSAWNRFEDGFFDVTSGTGLGHSYRIDHYGVGGPGKTSLLWLKDPLRVALGAGTREVQIRTNRWWYLTSGSICCLSTAQARPAGVTMTSATTSNVYGFVQTRGPGMGIPNAAFISGARVGMGALSGRVSAMFVSAKIMDRTSPWPVGVAMTTAAAANQPLGVNWMIE